MKLIRHIVSLVVMVVHYMAWEHLYTFSRSRALRLGRKGSLGRELRICYTPNLELTLGVPHFFITVLCDTCAYILIIDVLKLKLLVFG